MNNGYATIDINGQPVGLKFGLPAITEMFEKEIPTDESSSIFYTASLLFAGYKNNCLVKQESPSLQFQPFYDLVEDSFLDETTAAKIAEVVNVFTESKFVKAGKRVTDEAEAKKKSGAETT